MFQHLGIAGKDILLVHGLEECRIQYHAVGIIEYTNLIFQSTEIEACLATYGGIDHGEQGGGDIDNGNAALESRGSKSTQVGHHASAQVDEQ